MRTLKLSGNMTTGEEFTAGQIDRLTQERDALRAEVAALREALTTIAHCDDKVYVGEDHGSQIWSRLNGAVRTAEAALGTQPQPRTVREWLETIPCPKWRAAALENVKNPNNEEASLSEAVLGAFKWDKTPEGFYAWESVWLAICNGTELPPCPFGKEGA